MDADDMKTVLRHFAFAALYARGFRARSGLWLDSDGVEHELPEALGIVARGLEAEAELRRQGTELACDVERVDPAPSQAPRFWAMASRGRGLMPRNGNGEGWIEVNELWPESEGELAKQLVEGAKRAQSRASDLIGGGGREDGWEMIGRHIANAGQAVFDLIERAFPMKHATRESVQARLDEEVERSRRPAEGEVEFVCDCTEPDERAGVYCARCECRLLGVITAAQSVGIDAELKRLQEKAEKLGEAILKVTRGGSGAH